jgi:hypothetical protein
VLTQANLKEGIVEARTANAESKKVLIVMEKELRILENRLQDPFLVVKNYFEVAKDTLRTEFDKESHLFEEQSQFLQEQIHQMIDDKLKAHQNCLILE